MLALIVFLAFIALGIYSIVDSNKTSLELKKAYLAAIEDTNKLNIQISEIAFAIARANNKIGRTYYDIEEGGHYVSEENKDETDAVYRIVNRYQLRTNESDQLRFLQSYRSFCNPDLFVNLKRDILNLPEASSYSIGFE